MNRIASRATAVLILVLLLAGGLLFFLGEYIAGAEDWVMSSGSPHVYTGGKINTGIVADREGLLLTDLSGQRTYSADEAIRTASLHWVGDRKGNISVPIFDHYTQQLLGHDLMNGTYTYGDISGRMELTISGRLQAAALEAMGDHVGTVAVYNYQTGEILCAVTTPTFDPENVPDIEGDTTGAYTGVYVNRFLQSKYIPGSIFKVVTLATALETVADIEEMTFTCTGIYEMSGGDVTCEQIHGKQSLKKAFSNSCNCAFAQIVELIGKDKLATYVELFGITQPISFDGITTSGGNFDLVGASPQQIAWSGIGQHKDQINPCAFMTFMGAIAGDGVGARPHVVADVSVGNSNTYTAKTLKNQRILSTETARTLQEYLRNNVEVKYGVENFPELMVCAKTGTGEVGGEKKPNAMLAGFLMDEEYPLAFIVAIEEGGYGSHTCIPVIAQILDACVQVLDAQ